jgi:hypothetical protein
MKIDFPPQIEYVIRRKIGLITDHLLHLWDGDDLPTFAIPRDRAYRFSDGATADRVAQRLQARYATTEFPHGVQRDIEYLVVPIRKHTIVWHSHIEQCPTCGYDTLEVHQADGVHPVSGNPLYWQECSRRDCLSNAGLQHVSMFV